jgi:hypothetical protein
MLDYIKKYENFPMIDSVRYREISKDIADKKMERTEAEGLIKELLLKETDFKEEKIKSLPGLITENILLG